MTTIAAAPAVATTRRPVWTAALGSALVAAAATAAIATAADLAGISLDLDGEPIPATGFAVLTLIAVVIGYILAVAINRFASDPRRMFSRAAVALTAVSVIPDLTFPMALETRIVLMLTHLVAAAIVIPAIARRLGSH